MLFAAQGGRFWTESELGGAGSLRKHENQS
ncbi:MAG: hypothetical protein K0Q71_3892, partial [Thermomicrobiales bacterium]|nr:hypothetical protein [Thermomicrobiales bacterium]